MSDCLNLKRETWWRFENGVRIGIHHPYSERFTFVKHQRCSNSCLCKPETISQRMSSRAAHPGYITDRKQKGDDKDAQPYSVMRFECYRSETKKSGTSPESYDLYVFDSLFRRFCPQAWHKTEKNPFFLIVPPKSRVFSFPRRRQSDTFRNHWGALRQSWLHPSKPAPRFPSHQADKDACHPLPAAP